MLTNKKITVSLTLLIVSVFSGEMLGFAAASSRHLRLNASGHGKTLAKRSDFSSPAILLNTQTLSSSPAIEIKEESFGKAKTVTLKPQTLLDTVEHLLQMELETKSIPEDMADSGALPPSVIVKFHSFTNRAIERGDEELHFLADGKPFDFGRASRNVLPSPVREKWSRYSTYFAAMSLSDLTAIAASRDARMRLGSVEVKLSSETLGKLRAFTDAVKPRRAP